MGKKILTERDIELLQYEESIVIGNSANIFSEKCDVFYEEGTNFTDTFRLACETARNKGIRTIKILSGRYMIASPLFITDEISVVGAGKPYIYPSPEYHGGFMWDYELITINSPNVTVEGIKIGKHANVNISLRVIRSDITINNIAAEGGIEISADDITITKSKVLSIIDNTVGVKNCIVSNNIVEEMNLSENTNAISGNIIGGVPQKYSSKTPLTSSVVDGVLILADTENKTSLSSSIVDGTLIIA